VGDITKNFSRWEFACKCGCGKDDIDERLVNRIQVVRDIILVPITISSGCRCEQHNKAEGGESESLHMEDIAADWYFDCPYDEKLYFRVSVLLDNWSGGFHYYRDKKFFHTDIGRERRW